MRIVVFGGSGGLGRKITPLLDGDVISLSSSTNVQDEFKVKEFFDNHEVDAVINLSAYNHDGTLHKLPCSEAKKQIEVNALGSFHILRYCLEGMRARKFGRIILASSVLSVKPVIGAGIYSACKAFVDNLVKTCAMENAKYGITCNSLQLGYCEYGLAEKLSEDMLKSFKESIPAKRLCSVSEIVSSIKFLLETQYINGTSILLAGGL